MCIRDRDYVKDITLEELTRVYTMDLLAQSQEVTLSEDETAKVAEAAKEYYASLSDVYKRQAMRSRMCKRWRRRRGCSRSCCICGRCWRIW